MSDPGVRQRAARRLDPEPSTEVLRSIGEEIRPEQLDRHRSLEYLIGRPPHLAHSADRDEAIEYES